MADIIVRQVTRNIQVNVVGRRGPQGEQGIPGSIADAPVTSVNGLLGDVVLDTDDISEGTNKYVTSAEKTKLSNLSGVNTGDQDLSGYVPTSRTINGQPLTSNITLDTGAVDSVNGEVGVIVLDQDDIGDGTTYKQYSQTEKTKLAGIATGATANSSDATLLARANHTGTQLAATISDFSAAADARVAAAASTGTGSLVRSSSPLITTPTGIVKGDVGLGNVDNTSDVNKPVSTAQSTAINAKVTDAIVDAVTTVAPSQNAVFDALALKQPLDSDLTTIAGLTATTDNFLVAASSAWASRTPAQAKTSLALTKTDVGLANVDNTSNATERAATATLTNKRITPRLGSTASSATPTPNADTDDQYNVTALATGATFGAPTGTPTGGQNLTIRIKDDGTARTLAWNAIYRPITITMPTTTVISKTMYLGMKYNAADTRWDVLAIGQE